MIKTETVIAIATSLAAIAAFGGFGYYVGRDTAQSELASVKRDLSLFEEAEETAGLMELLRELYEYNDDLFSFSQYIDEIDSLRKSNDQLATEIDELTEILEDRNSKIIDLSGSLASAETAAKDLARQLAQKFTLKDTALVPEGQTAAFFEGEIIIGVRHVYTSSTSVNINSRTYELDIGQSYDFKLRGNSCSIVPTKLNDSFNDGWAEFSVICEETTG